METNKYKETEEAELYSRFSVCMLSDIYHSGLVDMSDRVWNRLRRFIAFYHPAHRDYVSRCDAWQMLMCAQTVSGDWDKLRYIPTGILEDLCVLHRDSHYDWTLRLADPYLIKALHQVVRFLFKFRGQPRNKTDWEAVKFRLSRPTVVFSQEGQPHDSLCLSKTEVREMREFIKYLIAPRSWNDLRGRFGPGASADGRFNIDKWLKASVNPTQQGLIDLIHLPFNDTYFGMNSRRQFIRYGITKIAEVPKSLKANRIVSSEPANAMFCQLAIEDEISTMLNRIYDDHVSLDNTEQHVRLLHIPGYTSIDLSDASDHVSRRLVSMLLPSWKSFLFSARSTFARFPDGTLCPLRTFAPMGAGHCFGILTAIVLAICGSVAKRPFHVYGDDIICHVTDYHAVVDRLTRSGLVVNNAKSCPSGLYRESCGVELLRKTIVTPLLMRDNLRKVDILTLEKWLSRLDEGWGGAGIWNQLKRRMVSDYIHVHHLNDVRWNRKLQRLEMKVPIWHARKRERMLYGEDSYRRWLTLVTDDDNERPDTMETWDTSNNSKPRLFTWQQSLQGRAERRINNLAGHITERKGSECVLSSSWRSTHEFPTFFESWVKITNKHQTQGGL